MDKELALIFEYKDAPETLKQAAQEHRLNSIALAKKQDLLNKTQSEVAEIFKKYEATEKKFRIELKAWAPKG